MNRIGTIKSIFIFEQREHLITAVGMTQYAFGVEGGGAGKDDCAALTLAILNTL